MAAGSTLPRVRDPITWLGMSLIALTRQVGEFSLFALQALGWLFSRRPGRTELLLCMVEVAVQSVAVVSITGAFIGMVIAVQTYDQFRFLQMETQLGAAVNVSIFKELGPVLAAIMLAGRIGCAMAAEIGTMKITEQIDALWALGANPMHYLVVPRFLACVLMTPLLVLFADAAGAIGGWFFAVSVLGINDTHYWSHCVGYVTAFDVLGGVFKSIFFGAVIALNACYRGFHCGAGAQGVGQAATEAFVLSFLGILVLDFFLSTFFNGLYDILYR
jgi:phospholipid/cholesterol/gamma-HCH transport system permease protein